MSPPPRQVRFRTDALLLVQNSEPITIPLLQLVSNSLGHLQAAGIHVHALLIKASYLKNPTLMQALEARDVSSLPALVVPRRPPIQGAAKIEQYIQDAVAATTASKPRPPTSPADMVNNFMNSVLNQGDDTHDADKSDALRSKAEDAAQSRASRTTSTPRADNLSAPARGSMPTSRNANPQAPRGGQTAALSPALQKIMDETQGSSNADDKYMSKFTDS
jgi:hypothetical protein